MKLELKHLAPYLPYGLKVKTDNDCSLLEATGLDIYRYGVKLLSEHNEYSSSELVYIKPVLRPLTSITNVEAANILTMIHKRHVDLESVVVMKRRDGGLDMYYKAPNCRTLCVVMGMDGVHLDVRPYEIRKNSDTVPRGVPMGLYEYLFKNHFDVFGLIDKGLAIAK